tara:strand:+ start:23566 stop:23823 length:258 start_codon:yes stop_codon:yes gene_type:complete
LYSNIDIYASIIEIKPHKKITALKVFRIKFSTELFDPDFLLCAILNKSKIFMMLPLWLFCAHLIVVLMLVVYVTPFFFLQRKFFA